ncbi:hypothetical protein V6N11_080960 [Hibiscus sabdariffa]|uniref:Uncharacterized protein n=1 Tax=Hibiscus sabdariffa TaxID=183260 RepID=A0ABR2QIF5_9ROSI
MSQVDTFSSQATTALPNTTQGVTSTSFTPSSERIETSSFSPGVTDQPIEHGVVDNAPDLVTPDTFISGNLGGSERQPAVVVSEVVPAAENDSVQQVESVVHLVPDPEPTVTNTHRMVTRSKGVLKHL